MRCIWCGRKFEPRDDGEHVVAKALGGSLTIPAVCEPCDNRLGNVADAPLVGHLWMLARRAELGLRGQRGTVPDVAETVIKRRADALQDPTFRFNVEASSSAGRIDLHLKPHVDVDVEVDGDRTTVAINAFRLDPRDAHRAEVILKSALRKKGLKDERLIDEIWRQYEPRVHPETAQLTVAVPYAYRHGGHESGLLKIAYELAWYWLGDSWLNDPVAAPLRSCVEAGAEASGGGFPFGVLHKNQIESGASPLGILKGERMHVAMLLPYGAQYVIWMRLLNVFEAVVPITSNRERYAHPRLDAVAMDAVTRTHRLSTLLELVMKPEDRIA
jgi:hypothetical protein